MTALLHPRAGQRLGRTFAHLHARLRQRFRHLGQAPISWIGGHREQLLDAVAADPGDNPELRHVGTDRVDHAGLLANEEMACPVQHQAGLLNGTYAPVREPSTASVADVAEIKMPPKYLRTCGSTVSDPSHRTAHPGVDSLIAVS